MLDFSMLGGRGFYGVLSGWRDTKACARERPASHLACQVAGERVSCGGEGDGLGLTAGCADNGNQPLALQALERGADVALVGGEMRGEIADEVWMVGGHGVAGAAVLVLQPQQDKRLEAGEASSGHPHAP